MTPPIVLLNPAQYLQLHHFCHQSTVFLTPSEQVSNPAHKFPSISPQPHSCGKIAALLLIPHPLTPHLHLCLLVSCSPPLHVTAAGPQLPTVFLYISHYFFSSISFLLLVSLLHLKPEAEFLWYFRVCMDFCLQRSKWFNTILWASLYVQLIH